jgi:methylenetetrahydrofolate dehydrogenase (NAD+)
VAANQDDAVDGILVYYPIWRNNQQQDRYIQETVALSKDVEGLCHTHLFNMYHNVRFLDPPTNLKKSILPCTPLAIVKALEHLQIYNPILAYGNRLFGKTITVINRSEVNGRPLAALLANDGATVYSVDITGVQLYTRGSGIRAPRHQVHEKEGWGLKDVLPLSDVVIAGVPSEDFKVPTDLIRDGAVCINFSSYRNFDGPAIKEKASIYVPSTGKVTIAVLLRNLVVCVHARPFCHVENVLTGLPAPRRQPPAARGVIGGGPESEERGFQGWLIWLHFWDFPYTFRFKCRRPRKKGE